MRLVIAQKPLRRILRWTQRVFFAVAVATLAYCGIVLTDTWVFQDGESRKLARLLAAREELNSLPLQTAAARLALAEAPLASTIKPPAVTDGLIGRIQIERLGVSAIIMEGTSRRTLRRAIGHIAGTAIPGQAGNSGLSGHRDTFFRPLRNIRKDDIITVTTLLGEYRYRVVSIRIVAPHDVSVLDAGVREVLTLVTCYPFYFVGEAPDRFIVRAERVV